MSARYLSGFLSSVVAFVIAFFLLTSAAVAQFERAATPVADPADHRFVGVTEDWNSPSLSSSSLRPVKALIGLVDDTHPGYTVELVELQWRWGDPIELYVLKPTGVKKPPVILYLYGYPSDTDTFKSETWQKAVTKDGFAAVGFVSALTGQRYHDRPMKEWFVSNLQECLATSAHDVQLILNYLGTRGDLDMDRLGMFAHGSGASIAILASAVDPRIKVLDTIDPWADWPVWMATSPFVPEDERAQYVKPEFLKRVGELEPLEWLPKIQAKHFRLQDATFEAITPAAAKQKLLAAVPISGAVTIYKTPDEFNAVVRGHHELEWIEGQLTALANPPATVAQAKK